MKLEEKIEKVKELLGEDVVSGEVEIEDLKQFSKLLLYSGALALSQATSESIKIFQQAVHFCYYLNEGAKKKKEEIEELKKELEEKIEKMKKENNPNVKEALGLEITKLQLMILGFQISREVIKVDIDIKDTEELVKRIARAL